MMSSFVQAQPVVYGASLGTKYPPSVPPSTAANCYYEAGCNGGQTVVQDPFYGATVDPARCYVTGRDYDAGGYGQQRDGYGGRYGQLPQQQQRMFMSDYQPHDVYRQYCSSADHPRPLLYGGGEELVRPAGDSPSAGVVPASSPGSSSAGLCSRYSPPAVPPAAVPQRLGNPPQPPVIYPWMKMVHSISGEFRC